MGLLTKSKVEQTQDLTLQELEFILIKLKSAQYRGDEFESYFNVYTKLLKHLESLKQK